MGVGTMTCGKFSQLYAKDPTGAELILFSWAQGFMSGLNGETILYQRIEKIHSQRPARDLNSMDVDEQKLRLRTYCNDHPLAEYLEAVETLYKSLESRPPN